MCPVGGLKTQKCKKIQKKTAVANIPLFVFPKRHHNAANLFIRPFGSS